MCDANHFISKGHNPQIQDFPSSNIHVSEAELWDSAQSHEENEWCLCSRSPSAQTTNWMELLHYVIMMPQLRPIGIWALRLALTLPVYCMSRFYLLMAAYKSGGERLWQRAGNAYLTLHFPLFYIAYMLHILKHPSHFFPTSPPPSLWEQQTSLFKFIDESCCCSYLPHNLFCDVIQSSVELYWKQSIQSHM